MEDNKKNQIELKKKNLLPLLKNIAIGVAIFGLGWLFGSGGVSLRQYSPNPSNANLPDKLDYSSVDTVYKSLKANFDGQLTEAELLEGLKSGLAAAAGDPYTEYLNPESAKEFADDLEGKFEGIGAQLGKDADNNIIVISPIAGYPAEKAGLKPKDIIAEIDGETAFNITISEAVDKIRGPKGTEVKLTIVSSDEAREVTIIREEIDIPSVESEIVEHNGKKLGVMTISKFGADTVSLAKEAAQEFKSSGVDGVILDLRSNPGGYLDGAVDISSLWLDANDTVLTERRDNVVIQTIKSKGKPILNGIPTVVLINEGSASASEIVAGALQDNDVATLVGQKSFGKGSVQQPVNLKDGGLLKVTIARWFTPNGKNIDKEGIEPDKIVEISSEDITAERDPQLDTSKTFLAN